MLIARESKASCCAMGGFTARERGRLRTVRPAGPLHVDAAARAAQLAATRGAAGVYNIAEDDGAVSIAKARRELGFDPAFRLPTPPVN